MTISQTCNGFSYRILTEPANVGYSSVACVRGFLKPNSYSPENGGIIDDVDRNVVSLVKAFVDESDLLSYSHIVDFECTRDNLNPDKWSRVKVDVYLMSEFFNCERELSDEAKKMCDKICHTMYNNLLDNGFLVFEKTNRR